MIFKFGAAIVTIAPPFGILKDNKFLMITENKKVFNLTSRRIKNFSLSTEQILIENLVFKYLAMNDFMKRCLI